MSLKIEQATTEELEAEFGSTSTGNDPETIAFIRALAIGQGFTVTAESNETDRMVKRRVNACAKEAFRELDWRTTNAGKLAARVKAIDTDAEKKATEEAEAATKVKAETDAAKAKADAEAAEKVKADAEEAAKAPNGANASQEPAGVGSGRGKAQG
jgi:colicin import membrane protein